MTEFLAMGGYAKFVWPSFGLTFVVMAAIVFSTRLHRKRAIAAVRRKIQLKQKAQAGGDNS